MLRLRVDVLLRLSRALAVLGEEASAVQPLQEALHLCDRHGLVAERVRCGVASAERLERVGDRSGAATQWRSASREAHELGDIGASETYESRAARLEAVAVAAAR